MNRTSQIHHADFKHRLLQFVVLVLHPGKMPDLKNPKAAKHLRKNTRRQLAATRVNRRSTVVALTSIVFGVGLGLLLLMITPPCMTTQALAALVMRGDKINLSVTTETNLSTLATTSFSATNLAAEQTNNVGLSPAAAVTNQPPTFVTVDGNKYRSLSYQQLVAFRFNVTDDISSPEANPLTATARVLEQIPAAVKAMNEKSVALTGYMLPVKTSEGLVTDFMLLPNTMGCCYGRMPRINEIIIVNTSGNAVKLLKDIPVAVLGTFHVGAIRNNNYLVGIYQMDCERVVEANSLTAK